MSIHTQSSMNTSRLHPNTNNVDVGRRTCALQVEGAGGANSRVTYYLKLGR